jgi:hypothetical protein
MTEATTPQKGTIMSWLGTVADFVSEYQAEKQRLEAKKTALFDITTEAMLERVLEDTLVRRKDGKAARLTYAPVVGTDDTLTATLTDSERPEPHRFGVVIGETTEFNGDRTITVKRAEKPDLDHQVELAHAVVHARRSVQNEPLYKKELWSKDPASWTAAEAWLYFGEEVVVNRQLRRVLGSSATTKQRFMIWWKTQKMNGSAFLKFLGTLNPFRANKPEPKPKTMGWLKRSFLALFGAVGIGGGVCLLKNGLAMMAVQYWAGIGVSVLGAGIGIAALVFTGWALFGNRHSAAPAKASA